MLYMLCDISTVTQLMCYLESCEGLISFSLPIFPMQLLAAQPYTWSQARALCSVPPTRSERHVASNMVDRDTGQRQRPQTRQACRMNAGDKSGKLPTKRKSGTGLTIFPVSACLIRCVCAGKTVQSHTLGRKCSVTIF